MVEYPWGSCSGEFPLVEFRREKESGEGRGGGRLRCLGLGLWRLSTLEFSYREVTKPLRPLGKAVSLLLEILRLLCKSMVSENLLGVTCLGFRFPLCVLSTCFHCVFCLLVVTQASWSFGGVELMGTRGSACVSI